MKTVVILDFGSQVSQLIARRAREANVYSELLPYDAPWAEIAKREPAAIILSGGPESTLGAGCARLRSGSLLRAVSRCSASATACSWSRRSSAATLVPLAHSEFGPAVLTVDVADSPLFLGVPAQSRVWMSHGDTVTAPPPGFRATRTPSARRSRRSASDARRIYGVQFHPEVVHTEAGTAILQNFLHQVAGDRAVVGDGLVRRRCDRAHSQRSRHGQRDLRALGRRRFGGCGNARVARDRQAADLRLRRHRADAQGRVGRRAGGLSRRAAPQRHRRSMPQERFLARLAGVVDPEEKRVAHRPRVHRDLRRRSEEDPRRALPGAGHALSRRDRIEDAGFEGRPQDQVAPQRRRLARTDGAAG